MSPNRHRPAFRYLYRDAEPVKGIAMIVMAIISLSGLGVIALLSRAPLWQAVSLHIDHGLEAAGRESGRLG